MGRWSVPSQADKRGCSSSHAWTQFVISNGPTRPGALVRGCTKISPGCKHCYAETFAERFRGVKGHPYEQGFDLRLVPEKLTEPFLWRSPKLVFVNSMSDLFQPGVPDDYIEAVCKVMVKANWHTFQVLTKRSERLRALLNGRLRFAAEQEHIWWGVSVEDRKIWSAANQRSAEGVGQRPLPLDRTSTRRSRSVQSFRHQLGNRRRREWAGRSSHARRVGHLGARSMKGSHNKHEFVHEERMKFELRFPLNFQRECQINPVN